MLLSVGGFAQSQNTTAISTTEAQKVLQIQRKAANQKQYLFIAGFSLLMVVFLLFKSAVNDWERANLYCALMYLCCFLNTIIWAGIGSLEFWRWGLWFNQMIPIMMLLLYREFLEVRQASPRSYHLMTAAIGFLLLSNAAIWLLPNPKPAEILFEYGLLLTLFYLPFAFLRYRSHPIYRYAAWSSWATALAFFVYVLIVHFGIQSPFPTWFPPINLTYYALLLDGVLFLFALTLRDRQILTERIQLQQQATTNELKALRSQMNPHFIFNALNSIKSFTLNNDSKQANFYLTKFAKLIRKVLDNSRSEKISLKNELETLQLYLDMEKLRVGDKFDYVIKVEEDVETEFIELPPMLLQPYVENAIWHGLMPKETKGLITISVDARHVLHLRIMIEDNGIGRQKSAEIKTQSGGETHKSFGMKISHERLDILKQVYQTHAKVSIEDLEVGTRVILTIPI